MACVLYHVVFLHHCSFVFFFFFQAEDGIRDSSVTGVQTCALPILQLHEPGKPGTPIPGNRLDLDPNTPLTTAAKASAKIYSTMTALASGLSPAQNGPALNATFQPTNPFNWRQDLARLPYHLNDKHSLY